MSHDGAGGGESGSGGAGSEIRVKFKTAVARFAVDDVSIAVPARFTRDGLSEVINHLLGLDPAVPFDFLINGTFLRSSLRKYMRKNGLSGESVIEIEYLPAVQAPEGDVELKHPDWVSSLAPVPSMTVTGCYDGAVRAYDASGALIATVDAHRKAVKCVAATMRADGTCAAASGAKDGIVKLWKLSGGAWTQTAACVGHTASVEAVAFSPNGAQMCSGSWDGSVSVWSATGAADDGDESKGQERASRKRARTAAGKVETAATVAPTLQMKGHTRAVTSVQWPAPHTVVSGSQDHSIRLWDLTGGSLVESTSMNGNKVVNCVSTAANGVTFATAHPDHIVRIWDSRVTGTSVVKLSLRGHTGWVSSVAWRPGSSHVLVSAGYEGSVNVWDIRSSTALHSIAAHSDKALAVAWEASAPAAGGKSAGGESTAARCLSGGADNRVRFFRMATDGEGAEA